MSLIDDIYEEAEEAAVRVREAIGSVPGVAIVLGSGLGALADVLSDPVVLPYAQIPHFPRPTIAGHHGNLIVGAVGGVRVLALQGRFHYYEGHDLAAVTFPIRVVQRLGIRALILTAATGGINLEFLPGDIVSVADHLNLLGANPLRGPNDDRLGPRFPDLTAAYSPRLRQLAREEAERLGLALKTGVYACLPGPSYETPAEIRMLRALGADVVGMSTVPEAIVARHAGMEVLALALVTNAAAGVTGAAIGHDDVLQAGRQASTRLSALIDGVLGRIGTAP